MPSWTRGYALPAVTEARDPLGRGVADRIFAARHESLGRQALRRFLRHRLAIAGSVILGAIVLAAILAPLAAPQDPTRVDLSAVRQPPGAQHWFGADQSGRDVWSRVVHGTRTSLVVGFGAVSVYVLIGTTLGLVAGYLGGIVDQLVMRFTDSVLSIPTLLIVIVFVSVVGPSLLSVIAVIGLLGWPPTARLVRGQLLTLRELEFVTSARVVGASDARIVLHHLLPNVLGPLTVVFTFGVANAILLEASLSFLGLGVRPPTPSLGVMIQEARSPSVLFEMPWLWLTPGAAIALTVLAVNLVGDGLRDALDPRVARRA
jgi:peptide/nickel transport system permease protein